MIMSCWHKSMPLALCSQILPDFRAQTNATRDNPYAIPQRMICIDPSNYKYLYRVPSCRKSCTPVLYDWCRHIYIPKYKRKNWRFRRFRQKECPQPSRLLPSTAVPTHRKHFGRTLFAIDIILVRRRFLRRRQESLCPSLAIAMILPRNRYDITW